MARAMEDLHTHKNVSSKLPPKEVNYLVNYYVTQVITKVVIPIQGAGGAENLSLIHI